MNRAAILFDIFRRNAVRRDARLPPLNVRETYERAVTDARWREVYDEHYHRVQAEIVENLRRTRGRDYQHSAGGRCLIAAMVARKLAARFGAASPRGVLGYSAVDAVLGGRRDERSG